jgi:hypothetical protein
VKKAPALAMLLEVLILSCCLFFGASSWFSYLEMRQYWTLRLKLSLLTPTRALIPIFLIALCWILWTVLTVDGAHSRFTRVVVPGVFVPAAVAFFHYVLPIATSGKYVKLRWKAWTGPSRTGISPNLTRYLGDENDWISMAASCHSKQQHPVERFLGLVSPFSSGIIEDVTDLLTARMTLDEEQDTVWLPRSQLKRGAYHPYGMDSGVDGGPLCLAHAILARNKGLKPQSLIYNLQSKGSFREFEENSVMWPRPNKTLRGFYHAELVRSFSLIGDAFVTAATEIALLLADAECDMTCDWLDGVMEQQYLILNNDGC